MIPAIALVFGYILGSIPFGLLLTKAAGLGDIRAVGSGNIGATNVLRTGKRGLAAATLVLDAAKGAVAVLISAALGGPIAGLWAGLGAVLGHLFPVWLGFRGGKGVATALGVLLAAAWPVGLVACAAWLAAAAVLRISSAASLIALAVAVPVAWGLAGPATAVLALAIALLVFVRHAANIRRLLGGTEPHIGAKG
ncbi:MAG TPA: glycerol-3-phosphate 1-O-acyltransferase PlsY [Acetobacteraceae bacterium]|nr:glycerol-3-phosphate 1-O-acyltransferase PlsY [Acetobacteraceae bacterium]